jgi:3-hydroxypropanoate dehydrogenase
MKLSQKPIAMKAGTAAKTDSEMLDQIYRHGRTHHYWLDKPVPDELLEQAYDLARMAPTTANSHPMRLVFVKSKAAKERLKPALIDKNVEKTMKAPVTAIIAFDLNFCETLPKLMPHVDAVSWFAGQPELIARTAFRSSTLQGAYFMLACRALGLDIGPMSGFNNDMVDAEFFADNPAIKSNWLCNIGYGDASKLHERSPRLEFGEIAKII